VTNFQLVTLDYQDIRRTAEILQKYNDTRIDFVDASVAAVAERLDVTRILTLDQRDFSLIRPNHCDYFELLPTY
jgi:predicted nucleic acid-binding protein